MAVTQCGSSVEVQNSAEGNSHVVRCDEGECNLFVHFEQTVATGAGADVMSVSELDQFIGKAVRTANLSLRRVEETDDGWMIVLKKD